MFKYTLVFVLAVNGILTGIDGSAERDRFVVETSEEDHKDTSTLNADGPQEITDRGAGGNVGPKETAPPARCAGGEESIETTVAGSSAGLATLPRAEAQGTSVAPVLECTLPDGSVAQTTPATGRQPVVVTVREFRELPLKGSGITIEPDREDYVINLPVIMLTDPAPQILQTNILGTNVQVKATPTSYTWNWGDGTQPLTTSDPGRPYPDHTVHHTYTSLDTFTITLETTWSGQFSIDNGSTWTSIDGTVTTTNTSSPVTVLEYVPLLVPDS